MNNPLMGIFYVANLSYPELCFFLNFEDHHVFLFASVSSHQVKFDEVRLWRYIYSSEG